MQEVVDLDEIVNTKAGELVKGKEEQIKSIMSTTLQQIQRNNIQDKEQIYRLLRKNLQPIQKIVNIDKFYNITINKMGNSSIDKMMKEAFEEAKEELKQGKHHSLVQPREGGKFVKKDDTKINLGILEQEEENEEETFTTNKNTMDLTTIIEKGKTVLFYVFMITVFGLGTMLYMQTRTGTEAKEVMTIREKGLDYIKFCEMQGLDRKTAFQVLDKTYNEFENNLLTGNNVE